MWCIKEPAHLLRHVGEGAVDVVASGQRADAVAATSSPSTVHHCAVNPEMATVLATVLCMCHTAVLCLPAAIAQALFSVRQHES